MWKTKQSSYPQQTIIRTLFALICPKQSPMLTIMKNVHFTKLVKAGHTLKEFNFRKLANSSGPAYHVDVTDDRANRIIFTMQKTEGGWILAPINIPNWINQVKQLLQEILDEAEN